MALVPATASVAQSPAPAAPARNSLGDTVANYDARSSGPAQKALTARAATLAAKPKAGVKTLKKQLGMQGLVDIDPLTGTARRVTKIDGFLTGPSKAAPERIALDYVRANVDVFGLSLAQVGTLVLRNKYVDVEGTTHLSYVQQVGGVTVFGNGLKAHIAKNGQLIQVDGSPVASLPASAGAPALSASAARDKAVTDAHGNSKASITKANATADKLTTFSGGDQAKLVLFQTPGGLRLGWQTLTMKEGFQHVIDAQTGRTLYRQSLVMQDNAKTWDNYPNAPKGGQAKNTNLTAPGWLPNNSPRLAGNVAHVFNDLNDSDAAEAGEEIPPSGPRSFVYPFTQFSGPSCLPPNFVCSWDPQVPFSWRTNANQQAVQLFKFLGTYHDHLAAKPIGFTRAAGNFEAVDGDAVSGNALDGAAIANGLPDGQHIDNANMLTPPDGTPPRMQMYLWHEPGTSFPDEDRFIAANGSDEGDIVYHEYTHGLVGRLIVDASGNSAVNNHQSGAMNEAWADWYANDFLVNEGLVKDTNAAGEVVVGPYVTGGHTIRTQALDCPVGAAASACPGGLDTGPGGYTYGDLGHLKARGPEVHDDGEIWAETLWDLRKVLGSKATESLVTRAMELSPDNPSFLDQRNSILAADMVVNKGKNQTKIWKVFAGRGMGWFAGSFDGSDVHPVEDFSMPPAPNTPTGSLTGKVTDRDTGAPAAGVTVAFGGHASGFSGDYAAITAADGTYTISGIFAGTYPKVSAGGAGFDPDRRDALSIAARVNVVNWQVRRDWAASSGGASIADFTPPDYTAFGCGPINLIDQSLGAGWGSNSPGFPGDPIHPKFTVIQLPVAVNILELDIDPSNTCGDDPTASTGDYKVETSVDGTTFQLANQGHFTPSQRLHLNTVPLAAGTGTGVRFIKFTMIGTQVADFGATCPASGASGCLFLDSTELAVYGPPA